MIASVFTAARRTPLWAMLVLLAALLLAQQQGIAHRIAHAGTAGGAPVAAWPADEHGSHAPAQAHDCAAYDAATLGYGPSNFVVLPVVVLAGQRATPTPFVRPAATGCAAGFHSRAPPRA